MELFDKAHYDSLNPSAKIAYKHKIRRSGNSDYLTEYPVELTREQRASNIQEIKLKVKSAMALTKYDKATQ